MENPEFEPMAQIRYHFQIGGCSPGKRGYASSTESTAQVEPGHSCSDGRKISVILNWGG